MMLRVRTTVTLDEDVASQLREVARERRISFEEALNAAVRSGLSAGPGAARPFRVEARPMGVRAGVDLDKALRLAAELDDAEAVRKLELRK
jgi:hypothetical protein